MNKSVGGTPIELSIERINLSLSDLNKRMLSVELKIRSLEQKETFEEIKNDRDRLEVVLRTLGLNPYELEILRDIIDENNR